MNKNDEFEHRFFQFAVSVVRLIDEIPKSVAARHLANQLLRSGTAVGANMREARGAESKADLIHKMQLALKEARESHYWLSLIAASTFAPGTPLPPLIQEAHELTAILVASVLTAKRNLLAADSRKQPV